MRRDTPHNTTQPSRRAAGFSFVELMFAVVVLGIGMIMVAALFPVGIAQSKQAQEATNAALYARSARDLAFNLANDAPAPGVPFALPPTDLVNVAAAGGGLDRFHIATPGFAFGEDTYATTERDGSPLDGDSFDDASCSQHVILGAAFPASNGALNIAPQGIARAAGRMVWFGDPRFHNDLDTNNFQLPWEDLMRDKVRGNSVIPTDRRFGLVPMYSRGRTFINRSSGAQTTTADTGGATPQPWVAAKPDTFAQFVVVVQQSRAPDRQFYTDADVAGASFEPVTVFVRLDEADDDDGTPRLGGADWVTFTNESGSPYDADDDEVAMVAQGAFVVIADDRQVNDNNATATNEANGSANGRVYRVGRKVTAGAAADEATWELAPGYDLPYTDPDGSPGNADDLSEVLPSIDEGGLGGGNPPLALLVGGRQLLNPLLDYDPDTNPYVGGAQAVGVYTSVLPLSD